MSGSSAFLALCILSFTLIPPAIARPAARGAADRAAVSAGNTVPAQVSGDASHEGRTLIGSQVLQALRENGAGGAQRAELLVPVLRQLQSKVGGRSSRPTDFNSAIENHTAVEQVAELSQKELAQSLLNMDASLINGAGAGLNPGTVKERIAQARTFGLQHIRRPFLTQESTRELMPAESYDPSPFEKGCEYAVRTDGSAR